MYRNNGDPKLAAQAYGSQPRGQWTTGLCGCCEEPCNCLTTCCCPFITFGQKAEILDGGKTSCCAAGFIYFILGSCACLYSHTYRAKLRGLYSLPEEPCSDCCVHCWCACCANCQEYREFKNRGVDPSAGWTANAEKMNRNGTTAPPYFAPGMAR
ncbi:cell number regulator 2-like [Ziziphus jujuba]|uniref:Cell number regulator 2-like n=1 Tax=Ziziphus jujuba TaxID=326968 RepID=A0ABM3ZZQ8_ZIZJJ|nr:cell number regulator 2-like [Ziziphus jujuba]